MMSPLARRAPMASILCTLLVTVLAWSGLPAPAAADLVMLANGATIEGVVVSRGSGPVVVRTHAGEVVLPERDVIRIVEKPYPSATGQKVSSCESGIASSTSTIYSTTGPEAGFPGPGTPAWFGYVAAVILSGLLIRALIGIPSSWLAAFLVGASPSTLARAVRTFGWEIVAILVFVFGAASTSLAIPALQGAGNNAAAAAIGILLAAVAVFGSIGLYLRGIRRVYDLGLGHAIGFALARLFCEGAAGIVAFLACGLAAHLLSLGAR